MNLKILAPVFVILIMCTAFSPTFAQTIDRQCEQCGMTVDVMGQTRFNIVSERSRHYVCCPICALKLIKTYGELNITSFCDQNGPDYPITIMAKKYGSVVTVSPASALIVLGGGCSKNRLVYNAAAADALLAPPNNGTSKWLSPITNATVLPSATRIGIAQAALQHGGGTPCPCEQCGMTVDSTGQARFRMLDANGATHIACCPVCAFRLVKTLGQLSITSYCDQYGPSYPIKMSIKQYGGEVEVTPSSALIIMGGGCAKNRIVYNSSAADALLAPPNNGTSKWLSPLTNSTVLPNATRMGIVQAALQYGGGPTASPSPTATGSPSPGPTETLAPTASPAQTTTPQPTVTQSSQPTNTPGTTATPAPTAVSPTSPIETSSPQPTITPSPTAVFEEECEACGMIVTADDDWHFKVTDGTGQVHYVECYMCALNLIKRYETLHIVSFCDWYGPDHPVTVDSTGYGAHVAVTPTSAMYLYAGTCEDNRVAYDQTAADALRNSYSEHTSAFQQHEWVSAPTVITVAEAVAKYNGNSMTQGDDMPIYILVSVATVVVLAATAGIFAYQKLRKK